MSILAIIEVAIGMIFAWLVMSLAGMYIQELIVSKLTWRSTMLQESINNLLSDPALSRQFYDHPLIKALHSGQNGSNLPSYIPSTQFSMALLDIIRNTPKEAALIQRTLYDLQGDVEHLTGNKKLLAQHQLDKALALTRKAIATDGGPEMTRAMLDEVKKQIRKLSTDFPVLQQIIENKFLAFASQKKQIDILLTNMEAMGNGSQAQTSASEFRTGLAVLSVTTPNLKQAIDALINEIEEISADAEDSLHKMRVNIETWFNNSMDRLSGWYKRRAQTLAFLIGLTLALLMNVDSLQLATQLWRDPTIRSALTAQAEALVNQNPDTFPTPDAGQLLALQIQISQLNVPVGWVGTPLPTDENGAVLVGDGSSKLCTTDPKSSVELFGIHFVDQCYPIINTPQFNDITGWLLKFVGLLITGIAAAQGAPFWFDILKNVVNVRSAGASPSSGAKG
jgi:hypothetical protein